MVPHGPRTSGGRGVAGSRAERVSRPRGSATALPMAPGGARGRLGAPKPDFSKITKKAHITHTYVVNKLIPTSDLGSCTTAVRWVP